MPFRILLITLLALMVAWNVAWASDDEIRERRALLVFDGLRQWANIKYQYDDQNGNQGFGSSYTHQFQENYNANLNLSVINPHLFNMSLAFTGGLEQNRSYNTGQGSSSGESFRYNYNFIGSGLDRSITPFTVTSYRNTETVVSPFSPTYTSDSTGNELRLALQNSFLPSNFSYSRRTVDNSGSGNDSSTTSNAFLYSATHQYKDFSSTGFGVSLSDTSGNFIAGQEQTSRAYSANLNNTLQWGLARKYTLTTVLQFYESKDQNVPQRSTSFSEGFQDRLGKALDLQVNYNLASSNSIDFNGNKADTFVNSGEATLTHRLFESVTTRLKAKYAYNDMLNGTESRWSGTGEVNYLKHVAGGNLLTANFSAGHEQVDNHLGGSVLSVLDESHPAVHQGDVIMLPLTGILKSVVRVRSTNPVFTYVEGTDYTVDLDFGRITILRGSRIDRNGAGTDLLISYTVALDPVLQYASDTFHAASSLTFKRGLYSVGAAYTGQWMSRLDGSTQNTLRDSSMAMVYFNGTAEPVTYRISFTDQTTGDLESRTVEGTSSYIKDTMLGRFSLVGTDRFIWYGATPTDRSFSENAATLSMAGIIGLSPNMRLTTSANIYDERSSIRKPHDIMSLRGSILYVLNKMSVSIDGQTSWNFSSSGYTRDDTVSIDFSRYF